MHAPMPKGPADDWPPIAATYGVHYWAAFWLEFWTASLAARRAALLGAQWARGVAATRADPSCTSSEIDCTKTPGRGQKRIIIVKLVGKNE